MTTPKKAINPARARRVNLFSLAFHAVGSKRGDG
jgi:hypothetical protein